MSNCPTGKDWNTLVNNVGVIEAYRTYIANGDEIPSTDIDASPTTFGERPKLQAIINTKKEEVKLKYKRLSNATDVATRSKLEDSIEELTAQLDILAKETALEDIEKYAIEDLEEVDEILSQETISWEDMGYVFEKISLWEKAGDFQDKDHLFFDSDEYNSRDAGLKPITDNFTKWRLRAEAAHAKLNEIQEDAITIAAKEEFGDDVEMDFTRAIADVNKAVSLTLDISEVDNVLLQVMHKWSKVATKRANKEARTIFEDVDRLLEKVIKKLPSKNPFEVYRQTFSNDDGRYTSDLIDRFTQAFYDIRASMFSAARRLNKPGAWRKAFAWVKENEIQFDVRKLFPDSEMYDRNTFTEESIQEHKQELIDTLGQKGYDFYITRVEEKVAEYKEAYKNKELEAEATFGENKARIEGALAFFAASNSPYLHAEFADSGFVQIEGQHGNPSGRYSQSVPRRTVKGKDTGYYDSKFAQIEQDDDLLEFYNYIISTLKKANKYFPGGKTAKLHMNSLSFIKQSSLEQLASKGVSNGLNILIDNLKQATRVDDLSTVSTQYVNPLSGDIKKELQTTIIGNKEQKVDDLLEIEKIRFKQETGRKWNVKERREIVKDIKNKLAGEASFDLGKLVKAYGMMAATYHHRSMIEDKMRIVNNTIQNNLKQAKKNAADEQLTDSYGKPLSNKGLDYMKQMVDYFMEHFYGYPTQKVEGKTPIKMYTKEEERKLKDLKDLQSNNEFRHKDGTIGPEEYHKNRETIKEQSDKLGGILTFHKIGNMLLKWVQLKGMAWNLFSAVNNMTYGKVSNFIEAADGRNFNTDQLFKAEKLVAHSMLKSLTFNKIETSTAKKIRRLMDKFDVLKESKNEIFKDSKGNTSYNKLKQKFAWLNPYNAQARGEYVNQAPIMIAMMMNTKITDNEGNETNLWEAYDDDGNIKIDAPIKVIEDAEVNIDKLIKLTHGNYDPDSALQIKQTLLGRAASQFRTWGFEGFATRFEDEFTDRQLGLQRKGRHRTGIGFISYANNTGMGVFGQTGLSLKHLLRKITFGHAYTGVASFEDSGFTEVDAANMRKNITEIVIYMGTLAVGLMMKAAIDDDDKKKNYLVRAHANFLLNQFNRMETELMFYTNPIEFEKLQKNALPIFSLITDGANWVKAVGRFATGDDELKSGNHAHESNLLRKTAKMFPGATQLMKGVTEKVY